MSTSPKLMSPGKWFADFDEQGNSIATKYDESFRQLLGYSAEEFPDGQDSWSLNVHPDDQERVDAFLSDLLKKHVEGKDYDIEYRIKTKWGYHWFHDYAKISLINDGAVMHFDGVSFDIQEIKSFEEMKLHDMLKKEVLDYIVNNENEDPIDLLSQFAEKIRVLIGCDQVIYRDLEKTRFMVNSPAIEATWSVPESYCRQCKHFDAHHPMYAGGYTLMDNCQEGWKGIPVYEKCPIKSSLTRIVYCNGEIAGYLAIHFVQKYHHFTEVECKTLEEFVSNFSLLLSRYETNRKLTELREQTRRKELEKALALAKEEAARNDLLIQISDAAKWAYELDAKGDLTSAEYSDKVIDLAEMPYSGDPLGWVEYLHPEDKDAVLANFYAACHDVSGKTPYEVTFRLVGKNGKLSWLHSSGRRLTHEDGTAELYGISMDVTKTVEEQRKRLLGAIPMSPDILSKANIGLWSFELDEGSAPRMYGDETMIGLVGLEHQVPPEEMYHAWYDNIDPGSYDLVTDAVSKMCSGEHAEVQYPWHKPDGSIMIVRCGGVRNNGYTKGIRIEGTHQDVSETLHFDEEQNRMVRELADQQRHVKAFGDMINAALWDIHIDDSNEVVGVNWSDEARKMLGYNDENDFPNKLDIWMDGIHPEDKERILANFRESITKRSEELVYDNTFRMRKKSGEYVWYHAMGRMENEGANLRRMFGVLIDISADKELEQNVEVIQALAEDYSSVYYVDLDTEKVTPYTMNEETEKKMSKIFRVSEYYPEAFRAYVDQFVYEPDKEMVLREGRRQNVLMNLASDNSYSIIFRGLDEGIVSFCEMKFVATRREGDAIKSVALGFAYKDTEIMAQYINEKLVAEYISAFMVDLDNDKYRIYRHPDTTSVMDRADRVWSLAMNDFAMECDDEYHDLVKSMGDPEFLKKELADVDRREYHYRFSVADQPWRRAVMQVIDRVNGVPSTIVATFMGIDDFESKIKDQEKQLAVQQEQLKEALVMAQSASRAKTTFLNNMSHDIRTPMNAIIGYTSLAASHIDNKEQVRDYLAKIGQSSNHLLSLINDVLDMSRIESGKMNLNENPENLSEIIHTIRDIIQADIHSKQLDFYVDAVDINDEDVVCDKLRLNQVLLNVLSNAIKYTPAGGTVTMRVTEKAVNKSGYAKYIFDVKDNGMGMSEEFLKTIFDPFTRVKSTTVSGIQGTGLGMSITKNIVDMMGGKIDVKSEPTKGTEVSIELDFKLLNEPVQPVEIPELNGLRGLVVDDDSTTCMSVATMLRDTGMRAEWCTSGKEAVLRAGEGYKMGDMFKVFIIDWSMPDMNGIETTRRIRKVIGNDIPIIVLTAYDWSDIEDEAREAGVTAFVGKPMFPSDLHKVLNKCLGKEKEVKSAVPDFDLTGKKILLVEDNSLNLEIATEILEEYGCTVTTAMDGDVAVQKMESAKKGDFDLVLMDIQMPTMDGYQATKLIRGLGTEVSKIPILAMTANAFEEDRKAALEAGMNEHIAKPIDIENLKKVLSQFLNNEAK